MGRRLSISIAPVLLLALILSACGYRPILVGPSSGAASGSTVMSARDDETDSSSAPTSLAVIGLRTDSPEPWLGRIVTDALRREMEARHGLELVADPAAADLVLRGRVRPLDIRSKSFSSFVAALEYELTLAVDLEVVRPSGDIVRLDQSMLSESDVYFASADIEVTRSNRLEALRRLSDLLASRVADSLEMMEQPLEAGPGDA